MIILDIGLSDISGFETCRQLRRFSEVPVIFLSARDAEIDRVVGLEIGADDYVVKPFSPREVAARVRAEELIPAVALDREEELIPVEVQGRVVALTPAEVQGRVAARVPPP